jgi:RNA polymerase sigma factor (sigma-70 family)
MTNYEATLIRASRLVVVKQTIDTDRQLLQQFAVDGAQDAFAALVHRHAGMVFKVCRRMLPTTQDAEDAFQATFLILARKAAGPWQESVANWLFTTARRVARDARRTIDRRLHREQQAAVQETVRAIDQLTVRELLAAVDEELDRLPPLYREPLVLFYLEELARDEIATRLGVPMGTVKIRLERGKKRLHAALHKRGIGLSAAILAMAVSCPTGASSPLLIEAILASLSGSPSEAVAALAKSVAANGSAVKSMVGMGALVAVASAVIAFGAFVFAARPDSPVPAVSPQPIVAAKAPQEGIDSHGDPLPAGALLRIGTTRFRDGGGTNQAILSPDGKVLATASMSGITLFDLATGRRLLWIADSGVPTGFSSIGSRFAFSPDGKRLYTISAPGMPVMWAIGTISTFDVATGKKLANFKPTLAAKMPNRPEDPGFLHLWMPAGSKHIFAVQAYDATLQIDPDTGKEVRRLPFAAGAAQDTPDGLRLFEIPNDGTGLKVYDADGKLVRTLEHTVRPDTLGFDTAGTIVAAVAGADPKVRLWDLATGKVLADVVIPEKGNQNSAVTALTIAPDRKTLFAGTQKGVIYRFDIASGKELSPLRKHISWVTGLFFIDGGKTLVSASWDGHLVRWDLVSDKSLPDSDGYASHLHLDRSPDSKLIAAADDSGLVELLDGITGRRIRVLQQVNQPAASRVAFAPDGRSLVTAHRDNKIKFWEPATGRLVREIELAAPPKTERGAWFNGLVFAPDGRKLLIANDAAGMIVIDIESGKQLWNEPTRPACCAFLPDGRSIVSGASDAVFHFRDAATGNITASAKTENFILNSVAVSPDVKLLATGHTDGIVCFRDQTTGSIQKKWQAHKPGPLGLGWSATRDLSFGPGGIWLASAGEKTVAVWDTATGKMLHSFEGHTNYATFVRFALDGRTILSSSDDLTGYVWDVRPKLSPADARTTAQLWDDLAGEPKAAFRAVWLAAADPKAPEFFGQKIPSPLKPNPERFKILVAELASPDFKTREAAEKEMSGFGPAALQLARKAIEENDSAEARERLSRLMRGWSEGAFTAESWRRRRAVVAMELAATPASQDLLKRWAADAPETVLSGAAAAALVRLEQLGKK